MIHGLKFRMIDRKKLFIITLLLIIIVPAVFIKSPISYVPLIFVILLVIFSYLYTFICLKSFKLDVESDAEGRCERLSTADYSIRIANKSLLIFPRVSFSVILESEEGYRVQDFEYNFILNPKEKKELNLNMGFPHIGRFKVIISKIKFFGFIDMLFLNKKSKWMEELLITPKIYEIYNYEIHTVNPIFSVNYHVQHKVKGGEFNDVREYIPGDPIKNIHWKLSAHSNTFITKIINADAVSGITLYIDFSSEENFDYDKAANVYDCMVESAYSVALYALNKDYGISFVFSFRNNPAYYLPKTVDELDDLIYSLPKVSSYKKYSIGLLVSEYSNTVISFDNIIVLTDKINNMIIDSLINCRERGQFPIFCFIKPDGEKDMPESMKNRLIKSGIMYCIVSDGKEFAAFLGGLK